MATLTSRNRLLGRQRYLTTILRSIPDGETLGEQKGRWRECRVGVRAPAPPFLGDLETIYTVEQRYRGYCDALDSAGVARDTSLVARDLRAINATQFVAGHLLDLSVPPTAFFAAQNLLTIGTRRAIRERGLQHHVALVGYDDFLLSELVGPAISVVVQDPVAIAYEAARLLFGRIDGDDSPTKRTMIATTFVSRGPGEIRLTPNAHSSAARSTLQWSVAICG